MVLYCNRCSHCAYHNTRRYLQRIQKIQGPRDVGCLLLREQRNKTKALLQTIANKWYKCPEAHPEA